MTIDFDAITWPTPAAYDSADPHKQRENLAYVWLQILSQCAGTLDVDVADALKALQFNNATIRTGAGLEIILTNAAASVSQP
jgi:hypothetical protein